MNKKQIGVACLGAGLVATIIALLSGKNKSNNTNTNTTMTNTSLPRGYRNNNPLNIRYNRNNNWQGKVIPNTDGTFEQFTSLAYGYRAAFVLLKNYITNYSANTVSGIISKWAPANENNTTGYINRVCSLTGFTPATIISASDKDQMTKLVYAMSIVENGAIPVPDSVAIEQGWKLFNS